MEIVGLTFTEIVPPCIHSRALLMQNSIKYQNNKEWLIIKLNDKASRVYSTTATEVEPKYFLKHGDIVPVRLKIIDGFHEIYNGRVYLRLDVTRRVKFI